MEEIRDEISVASVGSMLKDVSNLVEEPAKAFRDQLQQCITKVVDDFTAKCVKSCPETIIIDDDDIKEEVKSESVYDDPPNDHQMINLIDENEDNRDETQRTLEEELLMAEPSSSELFGLCNEITAVHKEITDNNNIIPILLDYHNDTDVQNEALDENILSDRDYPVVDDSNNDTSELNGEESQMQEPAKVIPSSDHSNIHSGGQEFVLSHENSNVEFDPLMEYQTEIEIEDETLISEIPIQEEVLTSRYDDGAIDSMSNTSSVNNAESTVNIHAMEDVSSSNQDNAVDKPQQLRNRTSKRKKVEADNVCVAHNLRKRTLKQKKMADDESEDNAVDKPQQLRNRTSKRKKVEADNVFVAHNLRKRTLKQKKMADDESEDDSNANTSFEIVKINKGLKVYTGNERNRSKKSAVSNRFGRNTGKKLHRCNECNKSFSKKSNLSRHLRTHTGERPYPCKECSKSFSQKSTLSTHLRTHTGERPYPCKECRKSFSQKSSLSRHLRIHTGEKPHRCNECNKSFSLKSNLSRHSRIHTGEKLHRCNECNKSFSQKSTLSTHSRIHTGERPYQCYVCDTSFRRKDTLSVHLQIHTGEKQLQRDVNEKQLFSCDYCGQKVLKKTNLESHILMCYKNHSTASVH